MAGKGSEKTEEQAWQDYLGSAEGRGKEKPKKGPGIGERLKSFLERLGIGGKPKGSKAVKKEVAISAAEGKKIAARETKAAGEAMPSGEQKPASITRPLGETKPAVEKKAAARKPIEWKQAKKKETVSQSLKRLEKKLDKDEKKFIRKEYAKNKKKGYAIDHYLQKVEERRKFAEELQRIEREREGIEEAKAAKAIAARKAPEKKKVPASKKPGVSRKEIKAKPVSKKLRVSKKVSLMPKPEAKKKARKAVGEKRAVSKKIAFMPSTAKPGEKAVAEQAGEMEAETEEELERKKGEIQRLTAAQVKKAAKKASIAKKARGWYGNSLKHKRAALSGWRVRKKVRLHTLRKKEKRTKLAPREIKAKRRLLQDDRIIRQRISALGTQIAQLEDLEDQKEEENRLLKERAAVVGVKIQEVKEWPKADGKKEPVKQSELRELVDAMKGIANTMAIGTVKQTGIDMNWKEAMTVDDQIMAHRRLIKNLEIAFYKRRVDFGQFREKLFEYQSKLAELRVQKKVVDEKMEKLPPRVKEMMKKGQVALGAQGIETMESMLKKDAEKEEKSKEDRKFAQRTAEALQKISERLGAMPKLGPRPEPEQEKPKAVPEKPRPEPKPEPKRPRPEPEKPRPKPELKSKLEMEMVEPEKPRQEPKVEEKPRVRIIERIRERFIPRPAPKAEQASAGPPSGAGQAREAGPPRGAGPAWGAGQAGRAEGVSRHLDNVIREKAAGGNLSKEQVDRIEAKLGELLKKYNIPDTALTNHIKSLSGDRLVNDFQKLIHLIEEKRENATAELFRPAAGFDIKTGVFAKKRETVIGKEKEIKKAIIETSFDLVLNLVQMKGIIAMNDVAKELKMSKKAVQECAEVLEDSRLISLRYPPIGSVKLVYPDYIKWKQKEKRKGFMQRKKK